LLGAVITGTFATVDAALGAIFRPDDAAGRPAFAHEQGCVGVWLVGRGKSSADLSCVIACINRESVYDFLGFFFQ
jgi:hypothetical protein